MPVVIICPDMNLNDAFEHIQRSLNSRFHNYQTQFQEMGETEFEAGQRETFTSYAEHAGGKQRSGDLYVNGVHRERLIG